MAVRAWLDDDSEVRVPVHAGIDPTEGLELLVLLKPGAKTGFERVMGGNNSSDAAEWTFGMDNSDRPFFFINDASLLILPTAVPTLGTSDYWLMGYSKSDLTAGRFHFCNLTTDARSHTAGDTVGSVNFPGSIAGGSIRFGEAGGDDLHARFAVAALRETAGDDAAWEDLFDALTSQAVADYFAAGSAWNFDQTTNTDDIPDMTGNADVISGGISGGSDLNGILGTTIVTGDDPPGWDFDYAPPPLDFSFRFSGGAANDDPALSIGGTMSSEAVGTALIPDFTRPDAIAGGTWYYAMFVRNDDVDSPGTAVLWLEDLDLNAGIAVTVGIAPEAAGSSIELQADAMTAPTGVVFTAPASLGEALSLGQIDAGEGKGVRVRVVIGSNNSGRLHNGGAVRVRVTPL